MKHIYNIYKVWLVVMAALVTACGVGPADDAEVDLLEGVEVEHTLVMYLMADNNLSGALYQNALAAEQGMVGALPQSRLVIYHDTSTATNLYEVRYLPYGSGGEHIRYCRVLKSYPHQLSSTPTVMRTVMEDVLELAPSRSYGLVMAGHGSGWFPKPSSGTSYNEQKVAPAGGKEYDFTPLMQWGETRYMGWDYVRDGQMDGAIIDESYISTAEIIEGLSPIHFDYIIFDACFMSSVEFLYDMRHAADYILASPVEILGCGLPYKEIVESLMSTEHDVRALGDIVMDVYMRDNNFTSRKSLALATIDCSKIDAMAEAVAKIYASTGATDCAELVAARVDLAKVQVLDRMRPAAFYDLEDFVCQLTDDEVLLADFRRALGEMVVENTHTKDIYSLGYTPDGDIFGYDDIESKVGGELSLCGVSSYLPRSAAPVTLKNYLSTAWARKIYGLD